MNDNLKLLTKEDGNDIIEFFDKIIEEFSLISEIKFFFYLNSKQKTLIKISKIPDQYVLGIKSEIAVSINQVYYDMLDEDAKTVLFSQEIDRIEINSETGTIKVGKASISTSAGIVKKFTYDEVERAVEIERQLEQQLKDKNKDKKKK